MQPPLYHEHHHYSPKITLSIFLSSNRLDLQFFINNMHTSFGTCSLQQLSNKKNSAHGFLFSLFSGFFDTHIDDMHIIWHRALYNQPNETRMAHLGFPFKVLWFSACISLDVSYIYGPITKPTKYTHTRTHQGRKRKKGSKRADPQLVVWRLRTRNLKRNGRVNDGSCPLRTSRL